MGVVHERTQSKVFGLELVVLTFHCAIRRGHVAAILQQSRAVLDRSAVLLLVPIVLRPDRRRSHRNRVFRNGRALSLEARPFGTSMRDTESRRDEY